MNSPFDPPDAIMAQSRYMCHLGGQTASVPGDKVRVLLWAYNAGPEATKNSAGKAPTAEAEHYANRLLGELVPKYTP